MSAVVDADSGRGKEVGSVIADVIIIGAGIAGLSAARRLAESGRRPLVLEAQSRVGGRLLSRQAPGSEIAVELGAEFVHGAPMDLLNLIEEAGLTVFERQGESLCSYPGGVKKCRDEGADALLREMMDYAGPDLSFASYLKRASGGAQAKRRAQAYVEGFNAADANVIGVHALIRQQQAEDETGDRLLRLREGYSALAEHQRHKVESAGGTLLFNTPVQSIRWDARECRVTTGSSTFVGKQAIIAVPLGVLLAESMVIDPLPDTHARALRQLVMGSVHRISLVFRERFWQAAHGAEEIGLRELSFLFADTGLPATWWTVEPNRSPILTGWAGGPQAKLAVAAEKESPGVAALQRLAHIFRSFPALSWQNLQAALLGSYTHDWEADPFSLGAYSYARTGGVSASEALAQPLGRTLTFAGEHTDTTGNWGTVHGALRSGIRAADQILALGAS